MFTFGNAKFHGSTGNKHVTAPVVGIAGDSTGGGYWLATQDGSVFNFGDAKKEGGAKSTLSPIRQITQITSVPGNGGYRLLALPAPLIDRRRRSVWARPAPRSSACRHRLLVARLLAARA